MQHYPLLRPLAIGALVLSLSACTTYRDIPPNIPVQDVTRMLGQPNYTCPRTDGGFRYVWSYQPNGQYAYAANISKAGIVDRVISVLTDSHFRVLDNGAWQAQDVLCEFGPPAIIDRVGLGEKNSVVWSYRYKQNGAWNSLMYLYMGKDGQKVERYHPGPDPAYDVESIWDRF